MFTNNQYSLVTIHNSHLMIQSARLIIDALLINLKHSDHENFASYVDQLHNLKWAKEFIAHAEYVEKHGSVSKETREREQRIAEVKF